ncbi:MAG TPA: MMPL family transporter [Kofleriaceae bacterium]
MAKSRAERFAEWLDAHRNGLLVLSLVVALFGGYLASRMSIHSDLQSLLPQSQRSVRDLDALQKRARPFGTVQVLVEADTPAKRERAGASLVAKLQELPKELITQFSIDDGPLNRYVWEHRFLFPELADLVGARDALKQRIERGKLAANPLYISLDDEPVKADQLADLEKKLDDLDVKAHQPPLRVSADKRMQLLVLQTTFAPTDTKKANHLIKLIRDAMAQVRVEVGEGVHFGLAGNITMSMYEHDSVLQGMTVSAIATVLLCAFGLLFYYRSGKIVMAILYALLVGVAATFAMASAVVGHLNVMTAFLFAIVIGNGVNAGMLLAARYLEELRAGADARLGLQRAIAGALRGTLAATATAAAAYTSLLVTDFRGFRQFGAIAGIGMLITWVTTFTVLPALLYALAQRGLIKATRPPALGKQLARMFPARALRRVLVVGGLLTVAALVVDIIYIVRDPFTRDWRDLQSSSTDISGVREVDAKIKLAFDSSGVLSGQAYQVVIAVDRRDQVRPLVQKLRTADLARPPQQRWIKDVRSLDDALPADQPAKIEVLEEIAALLDDQALQATLTDAERERLTRVHPPADLRPVRDDEVPVELAWPFIEKDGSRGKLIVLRGASRFNSFDVNDRLAFAKEVRALEVPPAALVAGEALIVADIVTTMERDAPKIIGFALLGSILAVILTIGLRRHGLVTLACGMAGVLVMIAACAIAGLKVHFLDLIALPITIGIGIDYAVNLAVRDRQEGSRGPAHLMTTTGSAVLMCSYTTSVGYSTLMLSANGGIRAFGLAALLGELACILMALVVAPAWLALLRERKGPAR